MATTLGAAADRLESLAARERRGGRLSTAAFLVGPATIFVTVGLLIPIVILFRYSLNAFVPGKLMVEALTVQNYVLFFTDPYYIAAFYRTVRVAVIVTILCLILALPLAYTLARTRSRFKNVMIMLIVLPLFVGNAVRAAGWMTVFGNRGFLNVTLQGIGLTTEPVRFMYTEFAVIVGILAVNLPYVVLTLQSVLEGIDRAVEEAAFSLGAGPFTMARRVLWPLALPGFVAGAMFCFILTMNAYATPVLLGGPEFVMMGPLVYVQFAAKSNWPFGAAVSFILMSATLILTAAANMLVQRRYRPSSL
jgi:putative spermidine/putrescine transport system permease protein